MTLAQRMLVLNEGRIEQIGTPELVYAHPASTFVASFIGSPPMNLLAGRAQGRRFEVGGQTLDLPATAPRDGELILGLRPEHAGAGDAASGWAMNVDTVEMLGAERLVYGRVGDAAFTLRIDSTLPAPRPGTNLTLAPAAHHLHWFDPQTKARIE